MHNELEALQRKNERKVKIRQRQKNVYNINNTNSLECFSRKIHENVDFSE